MDLLILHLVGLILALSSVNSQSCEWYNGTFTLMGAQGYEIQCIDNALNSQYAYTPCMSYALCQGQRYQAVNFDRSTGQCLYSLSQWDDGETFPYFRYNKFGDDIFSWTFFYTNGQICPDDNTTNVTFEITWKCDETAIPFALDTECGLVDGDECYHEYIVKSFYACVEGYDDSISLDPTIDPTSDPTAYPTVNPTINPTVDPTINPTIDPTADPTINPSIYPTNDPTSNPVEESGNIFDRMSLESQEIVYISLIIVAVVIISCIIGGIIGIYCKRKHKGIQSNDLSGVPLIEQGQSTHMYSSMDQNQTDKPQITTDDNDNGGD